MENLISVIIFTLFFPTIICDPNDRVFEEVSVGLVVDLGSLEGKIIKTSFTLALADFYHKNSGYRTRVSVLDRDSRGHPLVAFAAGEFHFVGYVFHLFTHDKRTFVKDELDLCLFFLSK